MSTLNFRQYSCGCLHSTTVKKYLNGTTYSKFDCSQSTDSCWRKKCCLSRTYWLILVTNRMQGHKDLIIIGLFANASRIIIRISVNNSLHNHLKKLAHIGGNKLQLIFHYYMELQRNERFCVASKVPQTLLRIISMKTKISGFLYLKTIPTNLNLNLTTSDVVTFYV